MKCIAANWQAPAWIKAYTTTRNGWGISRDKNELISSLTIPGDVTLLKQTHSDIAVSLTDYVEGNAADAVYTDEINRACVVLTADCLPLLVTNKTGTKVAAIHAGWRGLAAGVIENTINALGVSGDEILVWLGPAIGPHKFEVGDDVYDAFTRKSNTAHLAFVKHTEGKWLANLYQLATQRLNTLGITNISGGDHCTHSENEYFYSYRRDGKDTGRMASVIWISQKP